MDILNKLKDLTQAHILRGSFIITHMPRKQRYVCVFFVQPYVCIYVSLSSLFVRYNSFDIGFGKQASSALPSIRPEIKTFREYFCMQKRLRAEIYFDRNLKFLVVSIERKLESFIPVDVQHASMQDKFYGPSRKLDLFSTLQKNNIRVIANQSKQPSLE